MKVFINRKIKKNYASDAKIRDLKFEIFDFFFYNLIDYR